MVAWCSASTPKNRLTVSLSLLAELQQGGGWLQRQLNYSGEIKARPVSMTEAQFRWEMNQDVMATEKLAEGIRGFTADQIKLEKALAERFGPTCDPA
jgi:transaldolase